MSPSFPPHVRMLVRIPVSRGFLHRFNNLLPRFETPPFEGQRLERFPPRLDQIQVGGVGRGASNSFLETENFPDCRSNRPSPKTRASNLPMEIGCFFDQHWSK